eukprot:scpid103290/ scgid30314/ Ubiquitin-conjugating enzyme E2-16 kDa; Ubiquitin carrier protein; Ubiquitin-protein ligase
MEASNRLRQEAADLRNNPFADMFAEPVSDDLLNWRVMIQGPENSPYKYGLFHLQVEHGVDYASVVPDVTFKTKIFHPMVESSGKLCPWCLKEWLVDVGLVPPYNLRTLLQTLRSLLENPYSCRSHLTTEVRDMHQVNPQLFEATAKEWTGRYACDERHMRAGG